MQSARTLLIVPLATILATTAPASAQSTTIVTPIATIYPGDTISASMLHETSEAGASDAICCLGAAVGRIAKRTLLAGRPIFSDQLEDPPAIRNGATVKLVYTQPGFSITAAGQALSAGRVGDAVRVRNSDSGIVVSGTVAPDGMVRVDR